MQEEVNLGIKNSVLKKPRRKRQEHLWYEDKISLDEGQRETEWPSLRLAR
jgi:hypothetical protein